MQTEYEIAEGREDCKEDIRKLNEQLTEALKADDHDKIAEYASQLGMLGNVYLAVTEILR